MAFAGRRFRGLGTRSYGGSGGGGGGGSRSRNGASRRGGGRIGIESRLLAIDHPDTFAFRAARRAVGADATAQAPVIASSKLHVDARYTKAPRAGTCASQHIISAPLPILRFQLLGSAEGVYCARHTIVIQAQLLTMWAFPRRIGAALSPEKLVIWTIAEAVGAAVVLGGTSVKIDAAAHARLGGDIAWLVGLVGWVEFSHVGTV